MALLEQGTRVMSAVHKRLHYAQKTEFQILARLFAQYLPPEYPYLVAGGNQTIKQQDFDNRVDVIPVSDPNFFSMSQRISLAQQELQLVQSNPDIHNIKESYRRMYEALGTENIEALLLPDPPPPAPMDPAQENGAAITGAPLIAFPEQEHMTHIEAHIALIESPVAMMNPATVPSLVSHIFQHISMEAQKVADEQMPEQPMPPANGMMPPQMQQGGPVPMGGPQQPPPPNPEKEALKASIEVELMETIMPSLEEILTPPDDGVVQLKQQELQIRAQENQDDKEIAEKKLKLETAKLVQKDESEEERIKSQEDIAALKANVERERIAKDMKKDK
tara:strand:- start:724 stop:1725 length:1002 start_codon:yes stop_codon:yes gene_type:complete